MSSLSIARWTNAKGEILEDGLSIARWTNTKGERYLMMVEVTGLRHPNLISTG